MASQHDPRSFTKYGWLVCVWILVLSFQYGYHISVLNQIQAIITCRNVNESDRFYYGLPACIPMSDAMFSLVTAIYTLGGWFGSLFANVLMDHSGRKAAARWSSVFISLGTILMTISASIGLLLFGRFLVGIGVGFGLCVGPIFLAEISPPKIKANIGVLTQLAIVVGIMVTQLLGLRLATPRDWRLVLLSSFVLSVAQFVVSPLVVDSPAWLSRKGRAEEHKSATKWLWMEPELCPEMADTEDPLLDGEGEQDEIVAHPAAISIHQALKAPELRRPLYIVIFAMLSQQISGINAVLYYSNDILSKILPEIGPYISLTITIVNVLATLPAIFLVERVGRKTLLLISAVGCVISLLEIGVGLDAGFSMLAAVAVLLFVVAFATGLGPIPFVIIPEVSPFHAVSTLSSIGLSLNWAANFFVGLAFLPLRNLLSSGDASKEGRVFYVFGLLLFSSTVLLFRSYKG